MHLHFNDAALTGARTSSPLELIFGTSHQLSFACSQGELSLPVDMEALGCTRWTLAVMDSPACTRQLHFQQMGQIASDDTLAFAVQMLGAECYGYVQSRGSAPALFVLKGYTSAADTSLRANIQLPCRVLGNAAAKPRYDAVIAKAAADEAKGYRDEVMEVAELLPPKPEVPADIDKVPTVDTDGTYVLKKPEGTVKEVLIQGTTASLVSGGTATIPVGTAGALVQLDSSGKVPQSQLPDIAQEDNATIRRNSSNKLQAEGLVLAGSTAACRIWEGTLAEYTAGTVGQLHPDWICHVTDDDLSVTIDGELDPQSANPVQNRVVKAALDGKQPMLTAGDNITITGGTISATVPPSGVQEVRLAGSTASLVSGGTATIPVESGAQVNRIESIVLNGGTFTVQGKQASGTVLSSSPFPASFVTNSTTVAFCDSIAETESAVCGMTYLGGVSLSDMPFAGNAEVIVRIMTETKVIVLEMFSTDTACNHWYAMYAYGSMFTGDEACPWQGIMSISGDSGRGYAPVSDYQAASRKYVDDGLGAKVSDVRIAGSTASLVAEGVASIPKGGADGYGVMKTMAQYGVTTTGGASPYLAVSQADAATIDAKASAYHPVAPANLDYAVRSVVPNITAIPAATTAFTLLDATATTNSHSCTYTHAPSAATTYTLPAVASAAVARTIFLTVDMATTASIAFQDSQGTAITPQMASTPATGEYWQFMCEYSAVQAKWLVWGYREG